MSQINLISSNIRFDNPHDGKNQWKNRIDLLTSTLLDFSPDIICTQEGRETQLRELESSLGNYKLIDENREWMEQRMYPCIYLKNTSFSLLRSGDIWLSETPLVPGSISFNSAFPRLATWCELMHSTGKSLIVVNVHLDHILESTRVSQINVLLTEINSINTSNLPIILCGDFNSSPDDEVRKNINIKKPKLYDPWMRKNLPEESSHHRFDGRQEIGHRIDWILIDNSISCSEIYLDKAHSNGLFPSDHFPLKAKLNL